MLLFLVACSNCEYRILRTIFLVRTPSNSGLELSRVDYITGGAKMSIIHLAIHKII